MKILKNYTILYAEDESIIRLNIAQQLEAFFKKVLVAKDGMEALSLFSTNKPDVVMLDIHMPKMSGLDVAKGIRKNDKDIPIVILTAYTESSLLLDAIELNLSKYLVKPVSKAKLRESLSKVAVTLEGLSAAKLVFSENCFWDKGEKYLYVYEQIVRLKPRQQCLLELLITRYRNTTSLEEIMGKVWEDRYIDEVSIDSVKGLVSQLRKHLPKGCLKSVYGLGYVLS